ncbi:hypothetical protein DCAR_0311450 [Daucus carota subsp. sativus]|uniref:Uncharacterized protein n=1 Tax=Daucus carota subsp. sativus TaxID=79200 RepID=A0A166AK44_DAUCS|nr:PREDICTED: protein POLLENLESS 3-LIKE 2-like [Daucus carota subsp. sativus]WOG92190.1 hypothetical protein DCAR_0311450 [Daucus carota subsp. sativus]
MMNAPPGFRPTKSAPCSPAKPPLGLSRTGSQSFHVAHKVPLGDSPYVRAKHVQLVDKDPEKAIPLFWAAINAGDRVDSALKDMAIVMKQQNRAEEAIEAIKSLRPRCSEQSQESLDNILLDLFKRCGRLDDQIGLLKHKLFLIQQGVAFNGKRTKTARSQGKKFQVSVEQEATRLLGNLGWALMQQNNYIEAEDAYRRALVIAPDNNKMCNLGICLMKQGRISEAKETLRRVKPAVADARGIDSHLKAYERAHLESDMMNNSSKDQIQQRKLFDAFLSSSAIWQPQPCRESSSAKPQDDFADENVNSQNIVQKIGISTNSSQLQDRLKRTRSDNAANFDRENETGKSWKPPISKAMSSHSNKPKETGDETNDSSKEFEEAILAAVLGSSSEFGNVVKAMSNDGGIVVPRKVGKRLKVFQDITPSLSPRA